jgi:hypothetical protein
MDELNKPSWKPKFQSEFSMGELDFKRFDLWLGRVEMSSATINSNEIPTLQQVQNYFAELNVLYKSWRSLISTPTIVEEIDKSVNEAKHQKRVWEQSVTTGIEFNKIAIFKLIDLLDSIHTKLLDIKQKIGLGIVVKKNLSIKEKIKYGLGNKANFNNLPEA